MNLALQKRNEQLERWRQHEADAENRLNELDQNTSKQSDERTSNSSYSKSRAVQIRVANRRNISLDENRASKANKIPNSHRRRAGNSATATTRRQLEDQRQQVKFSQPTLFLNACANGDLDECKRLLDGRLVDINVTTCDGLTGLHEAAICGNGELVELLLDRGANINCCDNEGWTPLHAAASLGQTRVVELLLKHQADATIINCENFLAYDLARNDEVRALIGNQLEGLDIEQLRSQEELLIEQDIDRWLQSGHYEERSHPITQATVMHVLAAKGYVKLMKRMLEAPLLKKQINLEAKDHEGYTPLLAASFWNQTEIVELLIEHGANIFAQSDSGYKIGSIVSTSWNPPSDACCMLGA